MVSNLDRRIEALESLPGGGKPATRMTDREVLAVVAPDHSGHASDGLRVDEEAATSPSTS